MDAARLAISLGGELTGRKQILCPGPGHSPHDRSLSVRLDPGAPEGFLVHSFAADDWRECREHVRHALGFVPGDTPIMPSTSYSHRCTAATTTADALAAWDPATDAHDTVVDTYLQTRRLALPAGDSIIRHWPRTGSEGTPDGLMLALMRDILSDEPKAVHRTYVDFCGRKLWRKMLGPSSGTAIKFSPSTHTLVVAEGVEDGLAAVIAGMEPVWSLGSAGAIGSLPLIPSVATLVILGELDSGASAQAVKSCGRRWAGSAGKNVIAVMPKIGKDFADVWHRAGSRWRDLVKIDRVRP